MTLHAYRFSKDTVPPLSAFHATYQYCSSAKSANSLTPPPPLSVDVINGWPLMQQEMQEHGKCGELKLHVTQNAGFNQFTRMSIVLFNLTYFKLIFSLRNLGKILM